MKRSLGMWAGPGLALGLALTVGARQAPQAQGATTPAAATSGIPVTNDEVKRVCGTCHVPDTEGRMSRISYRRATPENWELTIRRMVSLNNAPVTPEQARSILKYLADNHGLAPEEARPVMFEADRSMVDFTYTASADTQNLCHKCHSIGRALSERRTPDEWKLLIAMHRGVYPGIDGGSGGFRAAGGGRAGGGGRGPARQPMDIATDHLSTALPLMSTEWASWSAARRPMRLDGRWALSGYQAGLGPVYGEVVMTDVPGAVDSVTTTTTLTYTKTGKTVRRTGRALVYTGFQWRGRSAEAREGAEMWREVAFIERDQNTMTGRWFTGAYDETGIVVTLRRIGRDPLVAGTDVPSLRAGAAAQTVRIFGANFPATLTPADVTFGAGVAVSKIGAVTPTVLTVTVDVAAGATVGPRDVLVAGAARPAAVVVYDKVHGIKVQPRAGMARLGGIVFPKRYEQFEAVAFHNGLDGKPDTADDLSLGMVDATWSLEEYSATFKEDDLTYVGALSSTSGLFTPNSDGPNPERSGNRNNLGDVWVVASYTPPGSAPLKGRAHLLVTVPLYMNWSSQEVGK